MTTANDEAPVGLTPRRIVIQLIGFVVGVGLLVWCVKVALAGDGFSRLGNAAPLSIAAMLACSAGSGLINATTFWITIRPVKKLSALDLTLINFGAKLLNYAPGRLGAIGRIWYHNRIDRLPLLLIGGWFAFIGYILTLGIAACLISTAVHPEIDGWWMALVAGQMCVGALLIRFFKGSSLLKRHGQGLSDIVDSPTALVSALVLRVLDLAMYALRMGIAARILEIDLDTSEVVVLAVVALATDLSPIRVGVREFGVAQAAVWLGMGQDELADSLTGLALVDSAAEAIVFVALGAPALIWLRMRVRRRERREKPLS